MKNYLLVALFVCTAALFWYVGSSSGRNEIEETLGAPEAHALSVQRSSSGLQSAKEQSASPNAASPPPLSAPQPSGPASPEFKAQFLESRAQHRDTVMQPIGLLLDELGVDRGRKDSALAVLKDHQAVVDAQMAEVLSGGKPPDFEVLMQQDRVRDEKLQAVLGNQAFAEYQSNLPTIPERTALSLIEDGLQRAGVPLTEQQSDQLLSEMVRAAGAAGNRQPRAFPAMPALPDPETRFDNVAKALTQSPVALSPEQRAMIEEFMSASKQLRGRALPR